MIIDKYYHRQSLQQSEKGRKKLLKKVGVPVSGQTGLVSFLNAGLYSQHMRKHKPLT